MTEYNSGPITTDKSSQIHIDQDIRNAATLPGSFYSDERLFERSADAVFSNSWQVPVNGLEFPHAGSFTPFVLLEDFLDEPLLWTRDNNRELRCLSNVCTHRANLLVEQTTKANHILCNYHGRRFGLDGKVLSMPGFGKAENCPAKRDDLPDLSFETYFGLPWISLRENHDLRHVLGPVIERMDFYDFDKLEPAPQFDRDYKVQAHWALYCDNYLEGFHIPFVHPGLNQVLDADEYNTLLFDRSVLQIGVAEKGDIVFDLPPGHADAHLKVAAYYWWIYPNTMLNFYPWGLSLNVISPVSPSECVVKFRTYIADQSVFGKGAGADLDAVEMEDEYVVENVQKGIRSRLYDRGRFSPDLEKGVHHFHRLLAADLLSAP